MENRTWARLAPALILTALLTLAPPVAASDAQGNASQGEDSGDPIYIPDQECPFLIITTTPPFVDVVESCLP